MATIQLGRTKSANRLISYAEKRSEEREGVNCSSEYTKSQMTTTRQIWGKEGGIQAHHVIQSFKPGEVTPIQANEIGQSLAKEIAEGHEVVVYTHTDKEHVHNHIVINSVNVENGRKYQAHGQAAIDFVRDRSDELCKENGLSIVEEHDSKTRYTMAESGLIEDNRFSWKDDIRDKIDHEKDVSETFEHFKNNMKQKYGIEVKERGKNITFINEEGQKVRGKTLGNLYEKETIHNEFEKRQGELGRSTNVLDQSGKGLERTAHEVEIGRGLSFYDVERRNLEGDRNQTRVAEDSQIESGVPAGHRQGLERFDRELEKRQRRLREAYESKFERDREGNESSGVDESKEPKRDREQVQRDRKTEHGKDEQDRGDEQELEIE